MKTPAELLMQADAECRKADDLAFIGMDDTGRFTVTFPDIALAYFGRGEELREQAFHMDVARTIEKLKVVMKGLR